MKSFISAYRSIVVGTICGLLMICAWSMRTTMLTQPSWALGQFCFLALIAGGILGGLSSYQGVGLEQSVKLGSKAAVISTIVASACFALMLRTLPGEFAALRGLLIPLVIALPAILLGTIGATIGALIFRRAEETELVILNTPLFVGISYWGVILVSILITALCPLYPTQLSRTDNPHGRVFAHWRAPEGMAAAPAAAWKLEMQRQIGYFDPSRPIVISKDERFAAGVNGGDIVVCDLESAASQRISAPAFSLVTLDFSPQGDRLFYVAGDQPKHIGVVDLKSHVVIPLPQPKRHAIPSGRVVWWSEKEVVFPGNYPLLLTLNLDSLEIDPSNLTSAEVEKIVSIPSTYLVRTERWAMGKTNMVTSAELPETEGVSAWSLLGRSVFCMSDLKYRMERCFPEIDFLEGDSMIGSSDGSRILRVRNGEATAFYFGLRTVPPLRWNVSMPHGPENLQPLDSVKNAIDLAELFLVMYAPLTNPLTGKTIGPDRSRPKAVMRFVKWEGLEAEICLSQDFLPFTQGDVFSDVYRTVRRGSPLLLKFEGPHRWWMVAPQPPADSTEFAKLIKEEGLRTRWSAANDKIVEEEKKSAEVASKAAQNQSARSPMVLIFPENSPQNPTTVPTREDSNQKALDTKNHTTLEKEIANFVVEHHEKATRGEITEMVEDYAQQVDHFNNGIVDRSFIYNDEFKYHQNMEKVTEEIDGLVNFRELRNGVVEARYVMSNFWRRLDGKSGRSRNEITLELVKERGVWQIIKHRSAPAK